MGIGDTQAHKRIDLVEARLRRLENITGGPGVTVQPTPGGIAISVKQLPGGTARKESNSGGTPQDLAHVQATRDTDDWAKATDRCPVTVEVVTDIEYNKTDHKLTFRTRLFTYDKGGNLVSIGQESDPLTLITTAVAHT
ncbi:MAG: hypothetical protein M1133_16350 [Armatimonadetes bacterium]|nr:hypothetical protein [Armatimonadota bacterium]